MLRTLFLTLGFALLIGVLSVSFGTVTPPDSQASPYFSALSDLAVNSAEACPCNLKICSGNVCIEDPHESHGCCVQSGVCNYTLCF